ncbi:DUF7096 domain-containing protein [Natrialbaceae archaeon A-gly3]
MTTTRAVVLAVLLAVCGLAIAPFASAALVDGDVRSTTVDTDDDQSTNASEPEDDEDEDDEDEEEKRPMGSEVSAFMQASGANTEDAVESKTFEIDYESADEDTRADVVSDRIDRLEDRIDRLEAERDQLRERKANGDGQVDVAYDARMSRLANQINALDRAIEDLENRSGVDDERLEELRTGVEAVAGPDIAAATSGLSVVEPPRGPPEETPGQNEAQAPENEQPPQADRQTPDEPGGGPAQADTDGSGSDGQQGDGPAGQP